MPYHGVVSARAAPEGHGRARAQVRERVGGKRPLTSTPTFIAHHRESDGATQSLACHLTGVAEKARGFAKKIGLAEQGELIGLLHDLGKYSESFQNYIKSAVGLLNQDEDEDFVDARGLKGKIDHSTAGAQLLWNELSTRGLLGQIVGQVLALCIASHHSGLIDCLTSDVNSFGEDAFSRRLAKPVDRSHFHEVLAKADALILSKARELTSREVLLMSVQEAMTRIVRAAPVKDDKSIVVQQQFGLLVRFLFSCLIDADRIDSADFEKPGAQSLRLAGRYAEWDLLVSRLEKDIEGRGAAGPIDHLRQEISRHCRVAAARPRGIFTLTAPTGGGKTLASLRFALHHAKAHCMDRVIYFVPFTTIIDQNADRVRRVLEPDGTTPGSVVLEHHSNLVPEKQTWRAKILSENWDAPVTFTTNVQFLEALFGAGTRGARRLHQLANAVLIFDEVQALPVSCVHLFNNAINFLVEQCESTVVLCTATQPLLDKVDEEKGRLRVSQAGELIPDVKALFDNLKRVEVLNRRKPGGWSSDEIAELALEETSRAGSCLVVVNTKESARRLYRLCQGRTSAAIYHLSTSMCPAHRKAVLDEITGRLAPSGSGSVLCFSTQLIEAGVDVDFGSVIRFAAGLDSIAQAAGRCNRHGLRATGVVHVVNPRDENLDRLADIRVGRDKAERVLDDYENDPARFGNDRISPEAMKWYYEIFFFARKDQMGYPVSANSLGHTDTLLNLLSVNSVAVEEHCRQNGRKPTIYLRQSFMAAARTFQAIDAPTQGIIVPYETGREIIGDLCAAHLPANGSQLLRAAQRFTVNVFPHVLQRLEEAGAVHEVQEGSGVPYLETQYYSKEFGLSESPVTEMEVLNG